MTTIKIAIVVLGLVIGIIYFGLALGPCRRREWSAAAFLIYVGALGVGGGAIGGGLIVSDLDASKSACYRTFAATEARPEARKGVLSD